MPKSRQHYDSRRSPCRPVLTAIAVCLMSTNFAKAQLLAPKLPTINESAKPSSDVNFARPERVPTVSGGTEDLPASFSLTIQEAFLNELVGRQTVDNGPVRDFVLGAEVIGTQQTIARTSLECIPSATVAMMVMKLNGTTQNETVNYTRQAAIRSRGNYLFELSKRIQFDGKVISTWTPSAQLLIDQQNVGAVTQLSAFPLIERFASQTALNVADRQQPIAERIAAQKVTEQVVPKFNSSVDQQIVLANKAIQSKFQNWLSEFMPELQLRTSTTDHSMQFTLASISETNVDHSTMDTTQSVVDVAVRLNDGILNRLLNKLSLGGMRVTDTQLKKIVETAQLDLSENEPPQLFTLILDDINPVSISFQNGSVQLDARFAIQPVLGEALPQHIVSIQIVPELQSDKIVLRPLLLKMEPLNPDATLSLSTLLPLETIQAQLEQEFNKHPLPAASELPIDFPVNQLTIRSVAIQNGEATIGVDLDKAGSVGPTPVQMQSPVSVRPPILYRPVPVSPERSFFE